MCIRWKKTWCYFVVWPVHILKRDILTLYASRLIRPIVLCSNINYIEKSQCLSSLLIASRRWKQRKKIRNTTTKQQLEYHLNHYKMELIAGIRHYNQPMDCVCVCLSLCVLCLFDNLVPVSQSFANTFHLIKCEWEFSASAQQWRVTFNRINKWWKKDG